VKTLGHVLTRRDRCYLFGRRAVRLTPPQAAEAWYALAEKVEAMGEKDVPKFNDVLIAFRVATVRSKRKLPNAALSQAATTQKEQHAK
jgi:hypothetical protein